MFPDKMPRSGFTEGAVKHLEELYNTYDRLDLRIKRVDGKWVVTDTRHYEHSFKVVITASDAELEIALGVICKVEAR